MKMLDNVKSQWTVIVGMVAAVAYLFTNFATAEDVRRMESRFIRSDIDGLCYKYLTAPSPEIASIVAPMVLRAVDDLCDVDDDDRRCGLMTAKEVCQN